MSLLQLVCEHSWQLLAKSVKHVPSQELYTSALVDSFSVLLLLYGGSALQL